MLQLLSLILFFIVFVQLFLALSLYLWETIYDYIKSGKAKKSAATHPPDMQQENVKLHISEGLIQVNRLPEEEQDTAL